MTLKCFDMLKNNTQSKKEKRVSDYTIRANAFYGDSEADKNIWKNYNYSKTYDCWIVNSTRAFKQDIAGKKIIMYPNETLSQGDYVHWDSEDNTWLVVGIDDFRSYQIEAYIQKCGDNKLKWYDNNGILQEWDIIIGTPNSRGGGFITDRYRNSVMNYLTINVQKNDNTKEIGLNQRFILGSAVFKITGINDYSGNKDSNLINFQLTETEEVDEDNFVDGIAWNNWNDWEYSINILNNVIEGEVGDSIALDYNIIYDEEEVVKDVSFNSSDDTIVQVSDIGVLSFIAEGTATITIALEDNPNVNSSIEVECVAVENENLVLSLISDNTRIKVNNTDNTINLDKQASGTVTIKEWNNGELLDLDFTVQILAGFDVIEADIIGNELTVTPLDIGYATIRITDENSNTYDYSVTVYSIF